MRVFRIMLLALGGLRRTPLRVALTTLGVTIASGALVSMVAFALGIQQQAETPFRALGLLDVIHVSPEDDEESPDAPLLDDAALEQMESLPGVAVACPDLRLAGIEVSYGEKTETVMALGLPRTMPILGVSGEVVVAGGYFSPGGGAEAILGERLASGLGFDDPEDAVGATVRLEASGLSADESTTFKFQRKELTAKVVGVFETPAMMPGPLGRAVVLPTEVIQAIPGIEFNHALNRLKAGKDPANAGYSGATVRVFHHRDLLPAEKAIQEMGFKTRTLLSRLEEMRTFFLFIDVLLAAVGTVALVVAGLGIINTLLMAVLERRQEIGLYKAIGASDGDLVVLFLTEAGIIGLMGGLGGLALGRLVSWGLAAAVNAYARSEGVTAHLDVFAFPVWLLVATVLFSAAISVLAGVYPAFRAARVDPIRSLRQE